MSTQVRVLFIFVTLFCSYATVSNFRTGFYKPAPQLKFSTRSGNCVILQSYSPSDINCTYCLCFPQNWYNCWTNIACNQENASVSEKVNSTSAVNANANTTIPSVKIPGQKIVIGKAKGNKGETITTTGTPKNGLTTTDTPSNYEDSTATKIQAS